MVDEWPNRYFYDREAFPTFCRIVVHKAFELVLINILALNVGSTWNTLLYKCLTRIYATGTHRVDKIIDSSLQTRLAE